LLGAVAIFAALACVLLFESLVGGRVLSANDRLQFAPPLASERPAALERPSNPALADPVHFMHPDLFAAREAVRGGELPLWNPYIQGGRPLLASQQAGALYPLNSPAYVLPFWDSLGWLAALKLLFGAVGMFLFCRALGLGFAGASLGGVAFAFSTLFVVWLQHPHAQVYAVVPWMFLFGERLAREGRLADALALALALTVGVLGGHPESFFAAGVGLAAFVVWRVRAAGEQTVRRLGLFGLSLVLGAAGAAILVIPFFELLAASFDVSRQGPPDPPSVLYGLFFPEMWGRGDKIEFPGAPVVGYAGHALYIGALPLLLAVGGLVGGRRTEQTFFLALAGAALLLMVDIPVWESLMRELPVLSLMYLHSFIVLAVLAASVLAAFGLERFLEADGARRRRMLGVMAAALVVPALVPLRHVGLLDELPDALGELPALGERPPGADVAVLASVLRWLLVGGLGLLLLWGVTRRRPARWVLPAAVVAFAALDLISFNRGFHPQIDRSLADPPVPAAVRLMQERAGTERVAAGGRALAPNTTAYYGLEDARGESLPRLERYSRLFAALDGAVGEETGRHLYAPVGRAEELLDLFAVRYVLDPEARGTNYVESRPSALPRAYLAHAWEVADDADDALEKTTARSPSSLLERPVIEDVEPRPRAGAPPRPGKAEVVSVEPERVVVEADAEANSVLVLNDAYYPGWRAEVDGTEAEIRPANAAFRAVELEPGSHRVVFEYAPVSVKLGGALSGGALLAIVAGLLISWRRRIGRSELD
jgi:hypothetical protein